MAGEGGDGSRGMRELAADPKAEHSGLEGPPCGIAPVPLGDGRHSGASEQPVLLRTA